MKQYRLVEVRPEDGKRYGKSLRTTLFTGPEKVAFLQAIDDWYGQPRKPYAELVYYHGTKRIYPYEF